MIFLQSIRDRYESEKRLKQLAKFADDLEGNARKPELTFKQRRRVLQQAVAVREIVKARRSGVAGAALMVATDASRRGIFDDLFKTATEAERKQLVFLGLS